MKALVSVMLCAAAFMAASPAQANEQTEQQGYCMVRTAGAWRARNYWPEDLPLPTNIIAQVLAACGVGDAPHQEQQVVAPSAPSSPAPSASPSPPANKKFWISPQ
jgi:hypothetical protein